MNRRVRWIVGVAVSIGMLAVLPSAAVAKAGLPTYPNAILYSASGWAWRMSPNGTHRAKLALSPSFDATVWSPDHSRIAYVHVGKKGATTVWTVAANGKHAAQIRYSRPWRGWTSGHAEGDLAWSPDGRCIIYSDTSPTSDGLTQDYMVVIDLKRHTSRKLAPAMSEGQHVWGLRYMPDGKHILEWEDVAAAGWMRLIRVSNGQSGAQIDGTDSIGSADVSPNGKQLVCSVRDIDTGVNELKVMSADGSDQTVLRTDANDARYLAASPWWSPDGSRIVYGNFDTDTSRAHITVIKADGTGAVSLGLGIPTSWQ